MRRSIALLGVTLMLAASTPVSAEDAPCREQKPESWEITIAGDDEPGSRMILSGVVYDADNGKPVPGVTVYLYHTDAEGYYSANRGMDNRNPRLCGILKTNARGEYRAHTIRPADYATGGVRAHMHYVAWGGGIDQQGFLLQFEAKVQALPKTGIPVPEGGRAHGGVQPLYRDADGVLHVRRDLRVRG